MTDFDLKNALGGDSDRICNRRSRRIQIQGLRLSQTSEQRWTGEQNQQEVSFRMRGLLGCGDQNFTHSGIRHHCADAVTSFGTFPIRYAERYCKGVLKLDDMSVEYRSRQRLLRAV